MLHDQVVHNVPAAAVLAAFVTVIASIHNPRLKTLVYSIPVPYVCAYLATRTPVNPTNMAGVALIIGYNWSVYLLRSRLRWPLPLAIGAGVAFYVLSAMLVRPLATTPMIWTAAAVLAVWLVTVRLYRPEHEPGHRSPMPWWLKAPFVFAIALVIYNATGLIAGGVTTFPYAGTFTCYEMRHSLRTLAGQFTINVIGTWALTLTLWATQNHWPTPLPIVAGMLVVMLVLATIHRLGIGLPAAVSNVPVQE